MNANKLFSEFSLKKIWDKLLQHDKAMSSTLIILSSGNWVGQEDGTFKNTVAYTTFKDTDKLTVDLYDDGNLSDTQLTEYEQYIDSFEIINGALVATANTKPTKTMTVVVKGDFEYKNTDIGNFEELFQSVSDGKSLLASAITDMGVETDANATWNEMVANIRSIKTGVDTSDATATPADITIGKTAYVGGIKLIGERPIPVTTLTGSVSFQTPNKYSYTHNEQITFEKEFDVVPKISISHSGGIANGDWGIVNVTTKGFVITVADYESNWVTFHWTAYVE